MRRITLLLVGMLALFSTTAQRKNFTYKFYGFVRGDLFYNSRANMAPIDGNFYLYPLDKRTPRRMAVSIRSLPAWAWT